MTVTIYHNPSCGTSRNTLAMIRQSGEEPEVIEYLKTPPSRARLVELITAMGISVRALLREKGTPYAELGLADPKWSDDQLLDFMLAHPILINRPIVVTPKGVKLCRPSEAVLDLLEHPVNSFVKEDGEAVTREEIAICPAFPCGEMLNSYGETLDSCQCVWPRSRLSIVQNKLSGTSHVQAHFASHGWFGAVEGGDEARYRHWRKRSEPK